MHIQDTIELLVYTCLSKDSCKLFDLSSRPALWQAVTATILVVLDISGSVQPNVETVRKAILSFISVVKEKLGSADVRLSIRAFDGRAKLIDLLQERGVLWDSNGGFFTDLDAAARLMQKAEMTNVDPSSNVHGAVVEGITLLDSVDAQLSFMLLFTDGTDQASLVKKQDAIDKVTQSKALTFVVAMKGEADDNFVSAIATGGKFTLDSISELTVTFQRTAAYISLLSGNVYVFLYCSPRRSGTSSVQVYLDDKPASGNYTLDASVFRIEEGSVCNKVPTSRFGAAECVWHCVCLSLSAYVCMDLSIYEN